MDNINKPERKESPSESTAVLKKTLPHDFIKLEKSSNDQRLEDHLLEIQNRYLKQNRNRKLINGILLLLLLISIIGTLIGAFAGYQNSQLHVVLWISLGLTIVFLIAFLIYTYLSDKKSYLWFATFATDWFKAIATDTYCDKTDLSDFFFSPGGLVPDEEVINSHYWSTIDKIYSRDRIIGKYKGIPFSETEISVKAPVQKESLKSNNPSLTYPTKPLAEINLKPRNSNVGAYGKYYVLSLKATFSLLIVKKRWDTYLPTFIQNLQHEQKLSSAIGNDFSVWCDNRQKAEEILDSEMIEVLRRFTESHAILDGFLALNPEGTYLLVNYKDKALSLPVSNLIQIETINAYQENTKDVLDLFGILVDRLNRPKV